MRTFLLFVAASLLVGCSSLPPQTGGNGIILLPYAFHNDSSQVEPILRFDLSFDDGTWVSVPAGDGVLVLPRRGPVTLVGIHSAIHRDNFTGEESETRVNLPLVVEVGRIVVASQAFEVTQTSVQGGEDRGFRTFWKFVPVTPSRQEAIFAGLKSDPNYAVWNR
ncbi:MAG TPA: hypothetical protein VMB23_02830 [Spirochaetia bacterium]|jgi:hypothetical protein|nr:hypothetical protein [Spirochaetia bacterium]